MNLNFMLEKYVFLGQDSITATAWTVSCNHLHIQSSRVKAADILRPKLKRVGGRKTQE